MANAPIQLTNGQLRALTYIEQVFWEHGSIPTVEKISEATGVSEHSIKEYWKVDNFRKALGIRGVDFNPERSNHVLTATQLALANMLMNTTDQRSTREKLKEINVSTQQYNAWLRQAAFRDHLAKRGEELFKSSDHVAYKSLTSAVGAGDVTALKLFFEMRGIYNPKVDVNVNVTTLLIQVVEIIARHVTDPLTLSNIADDLESISSPGSASAQEGTRGPLGLPNGALAGIGEAIYIGANSDPSGGPQGEGEDEPAKGYVPNYDDIEVIKPAPKLPVESENELAPKKSFEEGGSLLSF